MDITELPVQSSEMFEMMAKDLENLDFFVDEKGTTTDHPERIALENVCADELMRRAGLGELTEFLVVPGGGVVARDRTNIARP